MVSCCSSYTPLAYVWALLSVLVAIMCPFGLYFSNWLEIADENGTVSSVSSFRECFNESHRISLPCEDYLSFGDMYSAEWQAVTLMFGLGACLLILVALTAIFGLFVKHLFNIGVTVVVMVLQTTGVLLYIIGVITFPAGWDADKVVALCGDNAAKYNPGDCQIGWAYILIITGTVVGLVAASLSFSAGLKRRKTPEPAYAI